MQKYHQYVQTYKLLFDLHALTQFQIGGNLKDRQNSALVTELGFNEKLRFYFFNDLTIMASLTVRCGSSISSCMM